MKFLKLQVENFMALASAEVELDQRGLVLIQGLTVATLPLPAMARANRL